ncbi:TetR/AcrR family transcriptional regulator [Saccharothrix sp. Mg75]|uniref:TetR/AcrR family transcriptional regulator n=1 Tax=Saccharothrix sp. Mg75 TaxID=3445357 RepID=UPI003EED470B
MSAISERRERERAHRHRLIVTAARELAETEGWESVTTRRLADRVEYSQPVLYSHFSGKDAIVGAVALEGFAELAAHLRRARQAAAHPDPADPDPDPAAADADPDSAAADADPPDADPADLDAADAGRALRAVCRAYLEFATGHPALYQAMFVLPTDLRFASAGTPPAMRAGFDEFVHCFPPGARRELFAEVTWSALHGMAVLADGGRIPPDGQEGRIDLLVTRFADPPAETATP